jgi:single-strand DNA-binding protein
VDKVIIRGNLTKDIQLKYTNANKAVGEFTVAVNKGYGDKKKTIFIDCVVWEKKAEIMSQYTSKGSSVLIEGEHEQQKWEDKNGNKRSKLLISVREVEFLNTTRKENREANDYTPGQAVEHNEYKNSYQPQSELPHNVYSQQEGQEGEDDLPF